MKAPACVLCPGAAFCAYMELFGKEVCEVMLKTSQLEIFVAVVDCGTMSKAAEYLNTSQPYLSRVLRSMEEELGKTLLERGKKGGSLTRDGKFLYGYAKSILRDLSKIEELKSLDLERQETRLCVSFYSLFVNRNLFLRLVSNNLSNSVVLSVREDNLSQMFENLLSGSCEMGIAVINDIEFAAVQSAAIAKNIAYEILDVSPLYVHLGAHHPCFEKEEIHIRDLMYSTYMHIPFDQYSKARLDIRIDGYYMKEFKQTMAVDNYSLMMYLLQETDSFIFGNQWQREMMSRHGIKSKKLRNTDIRMHLVLFFKGDKLSKTGEKLMELFREEYLTQLYL